VVHAAATPGFRPTTIAYQATPMTTSLLASSVLVLAGMLAAGAAGMLTSSIMGQGKRRENLYDRLYSLRWGDATTNNYGFAPAETVEPERFQLQLYTELLKLLEDTAGAAGIERVLEVSCGRGGGLRHLVQRLPGAKQVVGLDSSMHAIRFCRTRYAALPHVAFVRAHALRLPFPAGSFDLVINVEASHAYRDDAAFLREVRRVLRVRGRLLYADHRTRRKVPRLEQLARAAGFAGALHDVTSNVVRACDLDSERRKALIRSGLPWWSRPFGRGRLERYAGIPGTAAYERLRSRDRMYFIACLTVGQEELGEPAAPRPGRAA
ncbi:MAG TPA: methyltransferase domain-containing protein, partial [Geminicoccaceae bacterium]|nr:methyltransferase domain-containing protein [Geminicoccaceae bacterium]